MDHGVVRFKYPLWTIETCQPFNQIVFLFSKRKYIVCVQCQLG